MARLIIFLSVLSFLFIFGCSDLPVDPVSGKSESPESQSRHDISSAANAEAESFIPEPPLVSQEYHGILNETLDGAEIPAEGEVFFLYNPDEKSIHYELQLENIDKVEQVYIALTSRDANRTPFESVALLYPAEEKPGAGSENERAYRIKGEITEKDLFGSLRGKGLESLIQSFEHGTAFLHLYSSFSRSVAARGKIL